MMKALGYDRFRNPESVPISYDEFYQDLHFLAFDLSPALGKMKSWRRRIIIIDSDSGYQDSLPIIGNMRLHIKLKDPVTTQTHLISWFTNRLQLEINPQGAVMRNLRELAGL